MISNELDTIVKLAEREGLLSRRGMLAGGLATVALAATPSLAKAVEEGPSKEKILRYLRRSVSVSYLDEGTPVIGSGYLDWYDLNDNKRPKPHSGIDIAQPYGTPVVAAASGLAQNNDGRYGGRQVRILHDASLYLKTVGEEELQFGISLVMATIYSHLSSSEIPSHYSGSKLLPVKRGQVIGAVGKSGEWAGPTSHLHFSLDTLGPNKRWADHWEHVNPHLLWAKGPGQVTRYDPSQTYSGSFGLRLTFPLKPLPEKTARL